MRTSIKKIIIFITILSVLPVGGFSRKASAAGNFTVTTGVHLRESASASSKSLTVVPQGTSVVVTEHNPADWSKVTTGSNSGYIRSDFLKFKVDDTEPFRVTAGVHLREAASTSSASLTVIFQGASVDVLEHDPAGWSKVTSGSITGYIRSDFLKHSGTVLNNTDTNQPAGTDNGEIQGVIAQLKITGNNVNLRETPSTASSSKVLKTLAKDTVVDLLEDAGSGWSKIHHNGTTGYVRSDFLAQIGSHSQPDSLIMYTTGNVNLRSSASAANMNNFIRTLPKGTAVEVITKESNGWSKVVSNSTEGYIKSDLLTATAPPVPQGEQSIRYVTGNGVNLRARATTASSIIRVLPRGTAVTVLADEAGGWSKVIYNNTEGYIKSEYLSSTQPSTDEQPISIMRTATAVNLRAGPAVTTTKIDTVAAGADVEVFAHEANGWSRVRVRGTNGYIRSDLLVTGATVELVTMSEVRDLLPSRKNIRVVDVRTGVSFNIMIFSKGTHADYDFPTAADTDAMFSTRNGVRSWSARPVWVYVGDRIFAAATHGMPHDVSFVSGNGVTGHFCLHFKDTVTNSKSYQADLRASVQEAYDKRPR